MATRLATATRNAMANGAVDLLDAGSGPGYVEVRTGSQPATANTAASGTLLGTLTCSDPAFGDAASGTATANAVTSDSSADATGTAGWFRAYDSAGNPVMDGSCGASGSGADMILDSTSVTAGGTIAVTSWTFTQPAA